MRLLVAAFACVLLICSAAADLPCAPACEHGRCVAEYGVLSCQCDDNWSGPACSQFVCDVDSGVCQNGGTCFMDPSNSTIHVCACSPGYYGESCQYQLNAESCDGQTCSGYGTCVGVAGVPGYECLCEEERHGALCQYEGAEPCDMPHVQQCFGHGRCTSANKQFNCSCDVGYLGNCDQLEPTHNACRIILREEGSSPCQNGGMCNPVVEPYGYTCDCPGAFTGSNCTVPFDPCEENTCYNGGTCSVTAGGHYFECACPEGDSDWQCEIPPPGTVDPDSCRGTLVMPSSPMCVCPAGYSGLHCEISPVCTTASCPANSRCVADEGEGSGYVCVCDEGWGGQRCEVALSQCSTNASVCSVPSCSELVNNSRCDAQCNVRECGFDGGDCVMGEPWKDCSLDHCRQMYLNGRCDVECNTAKCLFDGGECAPPTKVCPVTELCLLLGEDGVCQEQCNTLECPYDGADCSGQTEEFALGRLVLILVSEPDRPFTSPWREEFLRALSGLINSIPVVERYTLLTDEQLLDRDIQPVPGKLVYEVVMRVDITQCRQYCPENTTEVRDWIQAAISNGQSSFGAFNIQDVSSPEDPPPTPSTVVYAIIGVCVVLVVMAILVVLVLLGKRKRVTAKLWRPTSPSDTAASGEVATGGQAGNSVTATDSTLALESKDYMESGAKKAKMPSNAQTEWVNVTAPASSSPDAEHVAIGQQGRDLRKWGVVHTRDVGKLVQQYKRFNGCNVNVDTPGPGGFTPLMLVVMRRPGTVSSLNYQSRSSSESSSDDQTALIPAAAAAAAASHGNPRHMMVPPVDSTVATLIEVKANLDAVNDYGQTALHLAAACSRPEYVDLLVEAGANPNVQDNWGQSPLHSAIVAGAEGSFMVLLNCPRTKINLKSDGGVTPLMSAVKMVNGFMVKQLLKRDSEIIASVDDDGRTAVHWAAMVDNIDALRVLVKCGAETIKDAQDNKGQTPLFLACREGSIMCVKHLIDCFANVTLLDNLEQSPMQIAMQKQYGDIVELLRTSAHGPLYMRPPNGFMSEVPTYPSTSHAPHHQLVTPPTSKKKKSKSAASAGNSAGNFHGKFVGISSAYAAPTSSSSGSTSSHLHRDNIAMSELAHTGTAASSIGQPSSYALHQSPPNYPPPATAHSPPLPPNCQPHSTYPATSNHTQYTVATTNASGYSDQTPSTYEQQVLVGEPEMVPSVSVAHSNANSTLHHSAVVDGYPLYPNTADVGTGTRPLQHLSETEIHTTFAPTHSHSMGAALTPDSAPFMQSTGSAYSPPQSGGSVSQRSPPSAVLQRSPNSYGTSPQSLTPSPESRQQSTIAAVGTVHGIVHVEPYTNYPMTAHFQQQQQFMSSTSV